MNCTASLLPWWCTSLLSVRTALSPPLAPCAHLGKPGICLGLDKLQLVGVVFLWHYGAFSQASDFNPNNSFIIIQMATTQPTVLYLFQAQFRGPKPHYEQFTLCGLFFSQPFFFPLPPSLHQGKRQSAVRGKTVGDYGAEQFTTANVAT